jgi:hypothetical protein
VWIASKAAVNCVPSAGCMAAAQYAMQQWAVQMCTIFEFLWYELVVCNQGQTTGKQLGKV